MIFIRYGIKIRPPPASNDLTTTIDLCYYHRDDKDLGTTDEGCRAAYNVCGL